MAQQLAGRAWAWLHANFPERQVYIRSQGRIQFFTFSSNSQITCAGLVLIFLGWVAFASVNVVFKDQILEARDHHYHQMQGTYENRVADLQLSYDQLNDSLISAEDKFKSTVDELAAKQRGISVLIRHRPAGDMFSYAPDQPLQAKATPHDAAAQFGGVGTASDGLENDFGPVPSKGYAPPSSASRITHGSGESELGFLPDGVEPQPRTARPRQAAMLDGSFLGFARFFFQPAHRGKSRDSDDAHELARLAQETSRAARISRSETKLVIAFDTAIRQRIGAAKAILTHLGIPGAEQPPFGTGGAFEPVTNIRMSGISDFEFVSAYSGAVAHQEQLNELMAALGHVPLNAPVRGGQFTFSSGFGPRVDPFTGRVAFHTGVDLAGPWGSKVYATAAGVVVWAGYRGGYGNMVEIDHGYGLRTRYGHLSSIGVRVGARVQEGSLVGRMGSTGRSTGPHVHYEVWLANSARNPGTFLELGRRLLHLNAS